MRPGDSFDIGNLPMKRLLFGTALLITVFAAVTPAASQSNSTLAGAAIGAGTGAVVLGPPGAVVGGVIGAVVGAPPKPRPVYVRRVQHRCYFDAQGYRRCRW
jgi:osmotically inducible lipoprotein OsmB